MMDSFMRLLVLVMLLFCWGSVSSQDLTIEGFLGEDVILPCFYNESSLGEIEFFWTEKNNERILLLIKKNVPDLQSQNAKYKDRVFSFQKNYKEGNFSIIMKQLQQNDTGTYVCKIPAVYVTKEVTLKVSGKRVAGSTASPSGGATGTNILPVTLISALSLLLCFRSFSHI